MFKISVIIPIYNGERFLSNAINSVINQSIGFENIELLCIDDNSTDNSKKIINSYMEKYDNIKYIFIKSNSGSAGKGRNIGIERSNAKYIMFLDQDDLYDTEFCEKLYNSAEKYSVPIAMADFKQYDNGLEKFINHFETDNQNELVIDPKLYENIFVEANMWCRLYKKDFIDKFNIRCLEGMLCEDLFFSMKSYLKTDKMVYLPDYYGYIYSLRNDKNNKSTLNTVNLNFFDIFLNGFYKVIDLFHAENRDDLLELLLYKVHMGFILYNLIKLENKSKKEAIHKIYEFEKYANYNKPLTTYWAELINKNILKNNFKIAEFYSKCFYILYIFVNLLCNIIFFKKIFREYK